MIIITDSKPHVFCKDALGLRYVESVRRWRTRARLTRELPYNELDVRLVQDSRLSGSDGVCFEFFVLTRRTGFIRRMSLCRNLARNCSSFSPRAPFRSSSSSSSTPSEDWEAQLLHLFHKRAPIADLTGMKLRFLGARMSSCLPCSYLNKERVGSTHGGVYCLVADTAGWFASARSRAGSWPLTTSLSCQFLKVDPPYFPVASPLFPFPPLDLTPLQSYLPLLTSSQPSKEADITARARVVQSSPRQVDPLYCSSIYSIPQQFTHHVQDICQVRVVDKEGQDLAYVTAIFAVAARKE
eukprot:763623-Hanusia_phi.AAC.5